MQSLKEKYAPNSICFGCGPANDKGLKIQSYPISETESECRFTPSSHHEAFPGMINGGIIGSLLDCHSNWTSAWHIMNINSMEHPPCTVTAFFNVKLLKPTLSGKELFLNAKITKSEKDRAHVSATLSVDDIITATCEGLFVAVKPGHPAYHRWH